MTDNELMLLAIEEAKNALAEGEIPVGAVVAKGGEVLAAAHNSRQRDGLVSHHAEILALEKAQKQKGDWRLDDAEIFVSLEPCAMCASAIIQSRVSRVVFGAYSTEGAVISKLELFDIFAPKTKIVGGFMKEECEELMNGAIKKIKDAE